MRRLLASLALFAAVRAHAQVAIDAPREISFFDAPRIRVTGLAPMHPVTLVTTTVDAAGKSFVSRARFVADVAGVIDTTRSIANGDYEGIDAMGPFWSAQGSSQFQFPETGSLQATIEVVNAENQSLATATIARVVVPNGVTVTQMRRPATPFVATLYAHEGTQRRPAIVTLTGSNGGIDPRMAPWFAAHGYDVLALGYFHAEGLPESLIEVPLESIRDALQWLAARPATGDVGIVGASKGAEAALLVASYFPDAVKAVAAIAPSSVVWEGADARARFGGDPAFDAPGRSSWTLAGKPLPFVRKVIAPQRLAKRPAVFLDSYAPALEQPVDAAARIPVERIRAALCLVGAGDDLAWPSLRMAREVKARVRTKVELWEYPLAGHAFPPAGLPPNFALGGSKSANARASIDAWSRLGAFFARSLRPQSR